MGPWWDSQLLPGVAWTESTEVVDKLMAIVYYANRRHRGLYVGIWESGGLGALSFEYSTPLKGIPPKKDGIQGA